MNHFRRDNPVFIVKKYYKGKEFSAVENPSAESLSQLLVSELVHMSEDPNFSISIGVRPRPVTFDLTPFLLLS